MADPKNYVVKDGSWQPLSDIMGNDYDTTKKYGVRVNWIYERNALGFTLRETAPSDNDRGGEYAPFSTIHVAADKGDDAYFKGLCDVVSIEISEEE